jgi:hypothetical protein
MWSRIWKTCAHRTQALTEMGAFIMQASMVNTGFRITECIRRGYCDSDLPNRAGYANNGVSSWQRHSRLHQCARNLCNCYNVPSRYRIRDARYAGDVDRDAHRQASVQHCRGSMHHAVEECPGPDDCESPSSPGASAQLPCYVSVSVQHHSSCSSAGWEYSCLPSPASNQRPRGCWCPACSYAWCRGTVHS